MSQTNDEFLKPVVRVEWVLGLILAAMIFYWKKKEESTVEIAVLRERAVVISDRMDRMEKQQRPCK